MLTIAATVFIIKIRCKRPRLREGKEEGGQACADDCSPSRAATVHTYSAPNSPRVKLQTAIINQSAKSAYLYKPLDGHRPFAHHLPSVSQLAWDPNEHQTRAPLSSLSRRLDPPCSQSAPSCCFLTTWLPPVALLFLLPPAGLPVPASQPATLPPGSATKASSGNTIKSTWAPLCLQLEKYTQAFGWCGLVVKITTFERYPKRKVTVRMITIKSASRKLRKRVFQT
ncbi:uncharacterized protein LOC141573251 [Camelus bactrianus]|uniref:Uncharacterized protein LOC123619803 n=1 Tax=Camelus bactrianus TaxID=9837 RepID=A0A9W3HPA8_CAMBA|nr:uncharacterized protein LOC123619803 [Camelus bactrianus]